MAMIPDIQFYDQWRPGTAMWWMISPLCLRSMSGALFTTRILVYRTQNVGVVGGEGGKCARSFEGKLRVE